MFCVFTFLRTFCAPPENFGSSKSLEFSRSFQPVIVPIQPLDRPCQNGFIKEFINDRSTASYVNGLDHVLLANAVGFSVTNLHTKEQMVLRAMGDEDAWQLRRGPKAWTFADWSNLESVASDRSGLEETPIKITIDVQDLLSFGPTHGGGSGAGGSGGQGSSWMI